MIEILYHLTYMATNTNYFKTLLDVHMCGIISYAFLELLIINIVCTCHTDRLIVAALFHNYNAFI